MYKIRCFYVVFFPNRKGQKKTPSDCATFCSLYNANGQKKKIPQPASNPPQNVCHESFQCPTLYPLRYRGTLSDENRIIIYISRKVCKSSVEQFHVTVKLAGFALSEITVRVIHIYTTQTTISTAVRDVRLVRFLYVVALPPFFDNARLCVFVTIRVG